MADTESFSKRLRKETRDIHKISDALINAKLAFALSDNEVWADGLMVFYEIFRFLEQHVPADQLPPEFHRSDAFQSDLNFYLGNNWIEQYVIRESVQMYLKHLNDVHNREPILLLPYVYHLYMGLLSGGQILQKKRSLGVCLNPLSAASAGQGEAVTHFETPIAELKSRMRTLFDELAINFDESTKILMIAESKMVFHLNNELVRSVRGVNRVNLRKFGIVLAVIVGIFLMLRFTNANK